MDLISTLDVQIRYNVSSLFATGCSFSLPEKQAVKMIFFAPCLELTSGKQIELVTLLCLTVLAHLLLSRQFSNLSASFLHFPKGVRRSSNFLKIFLSTVHKLVLIIVLVHFAEHYKLLLIIILISPLLSRYFSNLSASFTDFSDIFLSAINHFF